jgi:periplasmic protein TonB
VNSAIHGSLPTFAFAANPRAMGATVIVVALHLILIALVLTKRDVASPVALESRTITAELLQPEPVAAPAAIQSTPAPPPKPVPHVTREKPKVRVKPKPTPLPVAPAPSQQQIETPAPATPPTPLTPPSLPPSAAPTLGKPTMAPNAPMNVSHLDCRIIEPDYPMLSKRRGETGIVYVSFVVGLTGQIENIELKNSSGYGRLDDAALGAMRESSCKPYLENGEPVRAAYTQPFGFSLHD